MRRNWSQSALSVIASIAILLFAQVVVAGHADFDDSHPAGETCAICVAHAQLGSANVSIALPVVFEIRQQDEVEYRSFGAPLRRTESSLARGPPQVF